MYTVSLYNCTVETYKPLKHKIVEIWKHSDLDC
jgi:hypothetical protein